jgi:hypothetical protein
LTDCHAARFKERQGGELCSPVSISDDGFLADFPRA